MNEEVHDPGLLTVDTPPVERTGLDPIDAVLAVAGPRERANVSPTGGHAGLEQNGDEVLVETRVKVGAGDSRENGKSHGAEIEPAGGGESYGEFSWPEGYLADPDAVAKFVPLAKKLGLSRDSAQELADLYVELDRGRHQAQAEFVARNNAEWLGEIRSHPEFGGARLQRTGEEVAAMLRRYGSPLLTAQIRQMNVQNWPEMFYFLARISRTMAEDCSPSSGPGTPPPKSAAQILFPGLR